MEGLLEVVAQSKQGHGYVFMIPLNADPEKELAKRIKQHGWGSFEYKIVDVIRRKGTDDER